MAWAPIRAPGPGRTRGPGCRCVGCGSGAKAKGGGAMPLRLPGIVVSCCSGRTLPSLAGHKAAWFCQPDGPPFSPAAARCPTPTLAAHTHAAPGPSLTRARHLPGPGRRWRWLSPPLRWTWPSSCLTAGRPSCAERAAGSACRHHTQGTHPSVHVHPPPAHPLPPRAPPAVPPTGPPSCRAQPRRLLTPGRSTRPCGGRRRCLQELVRQSAEAVLFADLMPARWADWVRNAPAEQLRPYDGPNIRPAKGMWY